MEIRWGIIGTGDIAHEFADSLKACGSTLYGVANRTFARAEAFAKKYDTRVYESPEALVEDGNIDVVYIGATHEVHYKYIMLCIEHGKHVLCEKTLVINEKQMDEVERAAKEKGVIVEEAMTVFHMPLYRKLRDMIEEGYFGKVQMVQVNFGSWKDDPSMRFFDPKQAGGAILDIGGYATSFVRVFLDSMADRFASDVTMHESGVDDRWGIVMTNPEGQKAVVSIAMRAKLPKRGVVSCEKGYLEIDVNYPRACEALYVKHDGTREIIRCGDDTRSAMCYEVEDMEELIRNPRPTKSFRFTGEIVRALYKIRSSHGIFYPCE